MAQTLNISGAISSGWNTFKNSWTTFYSALGIIFLIGFASGLIEPLANMIFGESAIAGVIMLVGAIFFWIVNVIVNIGFLKILLGLVRNQKVAISELWSNKHLFFKMFSASFITGLLTFFVFLGIFIVLAIIGGVLVAVSGGDSAVIGSTFLLGFLGFFVSVIIVATRLGQVQYIVVDEEIGGMAAIKRSWEITKGNVLSIIGVYFLLILINIAGFLALFVGLLVTVPVSSLAMTAVYSQLKGEKVAKPAPQEEVFEK